MSFIRNLIFVLIFALLVFVIYSFLAPRLGFATDKIVYGSYLMSHDSDYADTHEMSIGYKSLYYHKQYAGVSTGYMIFKEADYEDKFPFVNLTGRYNFTDNYYIEGNIRVWNGDNWNPITGNLSAVGQKEDLGRVEFFVEKSIIDSHAGIDGKLTGTAAGCSIDYFITDELTAVGVIYTQHVTDGNNVLGQVGQLIYSPKWLEGAYIKGQGKWRKSDFDPAEYFAPEKSSRYDAIVGYSTDFYTNWYIKVEAGPGYQYIDNIGETGYSYRIDVNGWIAENWKLETYYASVADNGESHYQYNWGGIILKYYFE